jgi:hypothetical protein
MDGFFALAGITSINDVYFAHERGLRAGLWNFAVIVTISTLYSATRHIY